MLMAVHFLRFFYEPNPTMGSELDLNFLALPAVSLVLQHTIVHLVIYTMHINEGMWGWGEDGVGVERTFR